MSAYQSEWYLSMKDNVYSTMSKIHNSFGQGYKDMKKLQEQMDVFGNKTTKANSNVDELNASLNELTKRRSVSVDFSDINKLNREISETHKKIGKLTGNGNGQKMLDGMSYLPGGAFLGMGANPYVMGGLAIAGAGSFGYNAARTHTGFDKSFAKINATAQFDPAKLGYLRNDIMESGRNAKGADIREIPEAYEKILSAVNNPYLAKKILDVSLKGAQAGFTDINTVSNAVVGFKNIVGNGVGEKDIVDVLFGAKRIGKGELGDFAQYLPRAMAMAPKGTDYKDVAGMYSFMTTKGFDAQTSGMLLENVFNQMGRSDVAKGFKSSLGIDLYKGGKMRDMLGIFGELSQKMKGLNEEQQILKLEELGFRDMQAKMGMRTLIDDFTKLKEVMGEVKSGKNELDDALSFTDNAEQKVTELTNKWIYFKDEFGKLTVPPLLKIVDGLTGALDSWKETQRLTSLTGEESFQDLTNKLKPTLRGVNLDMVNKDSQEYRLWAKQGSALGMPSDELDIMFEQLRQQVNYKVKSGDKTGFAFRYDSDLTALEKLGAQKTYTLKNDDPNDPTNRIMDNISGGGSVKNFEIRVDKFQDQTVINPASLTEGASEAENILLDMFGRVVQGVELMHGGG